MVPMDIAGLLREALRHSGCMDSQIGCFDSHSTIEMQMKALPDISVAVVEGDAWIWAKIAEATPQAVNYRAIELMQFLLEGNPFSRTGQLHLCDVEGRLELRLMASAHVLSDTEHFAQGLDSFVRALERLLEILR